MIMNRAALERLKRSEIQKLCKDYGVKANLKTETLIDLLEKCSSSENQSPARRVSTRSSMRGLERTDSGSLLEEENSEEEQHPEPTPQDLTDSSETSPSPHNPEPIQTRSRKANDMSKLGVGRPMAAGGTGARAVTKPASTSTANTTRRATRSTRSSKEDVQVTEEQPVSEANGTNALFTVTEEDASPPPVKTDTSTPFSELPGSPNAPSTSRAGGSGQHEDGIVVARIIALEEELYQLRPLREEVQAHKSELSILRHAMDTLSAELEELRQDRPSSSYKGKAPAITSTIHNPIQAESSTSIHPRSSLAPSLLGKRHRDSTSSVVFGVIDEGKESDLTEEEKAHTVVRPTKKRPRIDSEACAEVQPGSVLLPAPALEEGISSLVENDAPPRNQLPQYFSGPITPPPRPVPLNEPSFGLMSTPTSSFPATIHSFPPEAPPSPSPPSNKVLPMPTIHQSRAATPRLASPVKPAPPAFEFGSLAPSKSDGLDSFMAGPSMRIPSDSSLFNFDIGSPIKAPSTSRTMYGTEADKFGDFGLDPFPNSFWGSG